MSWELLKLEQKKKFAILNLGYEICVSTFSIPLVNIQENKRRQADERKCWVHGESVIAVPFLCYPRYVLAGFQNTLPAKRPIVPFWKIVAAREGS